MILDRVACFFGPPCIHNN